MSARDEVITLTRDEAVDRLMKWLMEYQDEEPASARLMAEDAVWQGLMGREDA